MYKGINGETILLIIGVLLTWLIFVLGDIRGRRRASALKKHNEDE